MARLPKVPKTWPQFASRIRPGRTDLLSELAQLQQPILVAGCQRSGGTMLANSITQHPGVTPFAWSKDAELDAALVLSGTAPLPELHATNRYCFQTTYLNEQGAEYQHQANPFYLIWLIRNPYSVVYSMVYNWKRFALNEVFLGCGAHLLDEQQARRLSRFGVLGVPPILRACYAWLGKMAQCEELLATLPTDRMTTLSYEDLVKNKETMLNRLFTFVGLPTHAGPESNISTRSLGKADRLSPKARAIVETLCEDSYREHLQTSIRLKP